MRFRRSCQRPRYFGRESEMWPFKKRPPEPLPNIIAAAQEFIRIVMEMMLKAFAERAALKETGQ